MKCINKCFSIYRSLQILFFVIQFPSTFTSKGYVQTVAGSGAPHKGAKTDCANPDKVVDGVGTQARFSYPWGITYHASENTLYIGDCSCPDATKSNDNEKIRKIDLSSGSVTSLAGGVAGYRDGRGKDVQFKHVSGMAIDPATNIMYAVDAGNSRIRKVDLKSGDVTTFAGNEQTGFVDAIGTKAQFNNPQSIIIDTSNNRLYIGDTDNHAIRIISIKDGSVSTLTGGQQGHQDGHSKQAKFYHPTGIAHNVADNVLYVADHYNHVIRTVDTQTGKVSSLAGGGREGFQDGTGKSARFNYPEGLAYDAENQVLYVVEFDNNAVRMVTLNGEVTTLAGGYKEGHLDGFGAEARFFHPTGLTFDSKRKIVYVTDQYNHMVRSITGVGFKGRLPKHSPLKGYIQRSEFAFFIICIGTLVLLLVTKPYWKPWLSRRRRDTLKYYK